MPNPYQSADYYKSETVGDFRIGKEFRECHLSWPFAAQQLTIKSDSITRDIEYSFDGSGVAYRLKKGTDILSGGDFYNYIGADQTQVYLRIAPDEYVDGDGGKDDPIPFRVSAFRGTGGRST